MSDLQIFMVLLGIVVVSSLTTFVFFIAAIKFIWSIISKVNKNNGVN